MQVSYSSSSNTKQVGDRVVDTSSIPFMRSRQIQFVAKGLKPFTRVYPFFDNKSVTAYCKPTGGSNGSPLITDGSGQITGTFSLPNHGTLRFRTGSRVFKLTDNVSGNEDDGQTFAEATYTANGTLNTRQKTILTTRTITKKVTKTVTKVRWKDPLAQSFLIDSEGGNFISSIDIWFNSKDANIPVTCEIREMENGYPTQRLVPDATKTLTPSQVQLSTDGKSNATKFEFDHPIYLQDGIEYCFVLMANSTKYNVWISRMGELVRGTKFSVSKQPFVGVMFKSQNNSTWTAAQEDDIKFTIYRCKFNTNVTSNVVINNDKTDPVNIDNNGIYVTNGSNNVRVKCFDHGLYVGSKVEITGATQGAGIAASELNKVHTVVAVQDLDNFTIDVVSNATTDGRIGGNDIYVDKNYQFDIAMPIVPHLHLTGTNLEFDMTTTTGKNVGGSETPYLNGGTVQNINVGEYSGFMNPQVVLTPQEEFSNKSNTRSLSLVGRMSTDNDNISPIIDVEGATITLVGNRINKIDDVNDEVPANGGTALARYFTKPVNLALAATSIKAIMDVDRPEGTDVLLYYRTANGESDLIETEWTYLPPDVDGGYSTGGFLEHEYSADDIGSFSSFQIKVVLSSETSSVVPRVARLRGIALGT